MSSLVLQQGMEDAFDDAPGQLLQDFLVPALTAGRLRRPRKGHVAGAGQGETAIDVASSILHFAPEFLGRLLGLPFESEQETTVIAKQAVPLGGHVVEIDEISSCRGGDLWRGSEIKEASPKTPRGDVGQRLGRRGADEEGLRRGGLFVKPGPGEQGKSQGDRGLEAFRFGPVDERYVVTPSFEYAGRLNTDPAAANDENATDFPSFSSNRSTMREAVEGALPGW